MFGRESKLQIDFIISVSVDGCGEEEGSADQWLVEHYRKHLAKWNAKCADKHMPGRRWLTVT